MKQVVQAGELRSARVESLRALAALGVFATHSYTIATQHNTSTWQGILRSLPHRGAYGVELFFCLTGYLLYWPFVKSMRSGKRVDLKRYAVNRALRILPLYFISIIVCGFALGHLKSIREGWPALLLLSPQFSRHALGVNDVLWSLGTEMQFYLLLPFLAAALAYLSRGRKLAIAGMLVSLGFTTYMVRASWAPPHLVDPINVGQWTYPSGWYRSVTGFGFYFVPGMLLALLRDHIQSDVRTLPRGLHARSSVWMACGLVVIGMAVTYVPIWGGPKYTELALLPGLFLLVGGVVLPLRTGRVARVLDWKPLAVLGVASYSFYIWHRPVLVTIAAGRLWPSLDFYALTLAVAILVALVSYHVIEKPFLSLRKRWADAAPAQLHSRDRHEARPDSSVAVLGR